MGLGYGTLGQNGIRVRDFGSSGEPEGIRVRDFGMGGGDPTRGFTLAAAH